MWWLLGGFLGIFLLERFFPFHHHEPAAHAEHEQRRHGHAHKHGPVHEEFCAAPTRRLSWPAALLGFTVHSIVGGMALAASVEVESSGGVAIAGLGVFLVIVLHKPFDSLAVGTLMAADNTPRLNRHFVNSFFGLMVPLGVVLFALGFSKMNIAQGPLLGAILALSSGVFLCIALSDVLPELQFHRHDRVKLSAALILGIALAGVIAHYEAKSHQHEDSNESIVHEHEH
jgi:zinc and cadmium transporter